MIPEAHFVHRVILKTKCDVEGETFWRTTRYIGMSPYVEQSLIEQYPTAEDIKALMELQRKGSLVYLDTKLRTELAPRYQQYIPKFPPSEFRIKAIEAVIGAPLPDARDGNVLLAVINMPKMHQEISLHAFDGLTPKILFDKYAKRIVTHPKYATLDEVRKHNKIIGQQSQMIMEKELRNPLARAFAGYSNIENSLNVHRFNPAFVKDMRLNKLAELSGTINLGLFQETDLRVQARLLKHMRKMWKSNPRTLEELPETVHPSVVITYEFYPFIYDEIANLRLKKELFGMMRWNPPDRPKLYKDMSTEAEIESYIQYMLDVGYIPEAHISAIDVVVRYLCMRLPRLEEPYGISQKFYECQDVGEDYKFKENGFLIIRQNNVITNIIYLLSFENAFFVVDRQSPSGRYAFQSIELFLSLNNQPNYVMAAESQKERDPVRIMKNFVIFSVSDGKIFEEANQVDERITPIVHPVPSNRLVEAAKATPIGFFYTLLRRECYGNAIQLGKGISTYNTEVLYGTMMARGLKHVKLLVLKEP